MLDDLFLSDPEDAEVTSSTSDPEEPEAEDDELRAAAQLTQDFLCQVIQEEEGRGEKKDEGEQEMRLEDEGAEPQRQAAPLAIILGKLPTAASLDLHQDLHQDPDESETTERADEDQCEGGELDLDGIDDQEIEKYILNDVEVQVKTDLWMKQNAEYLKEQEEKEERIKKEKEQGTYKEKPKKSKKKKEQVEASSAGEAIERMLEKKKISSKINYDVLKDLNSRGTGSPARTADLTEADAPTPRKRLNRRRRKKNSDADRELAANTSIMGKRVRLLLSSTSKKRKTAAEAGPGITKVEATAEVTPDPESSSALTAPPIALEEEEEDEEEVEEECVSALQLVGDYGCEDEDVD